uniref:mRNA interferase RelE/StbE n=1 Tax=Candidatus Kentrum sp. SD TaxID=2126332 RepID=A0A450YCV4_9GAMM|nr:MAG: mRNA interferase RelE/StbE [Candidatus Kentron sp. SD]VFK44052.1 MAG: mRNA interferase RelE/StbE [Candidatus Kentron sp. SD]
MSYRLKFVPAAMREWRKLAPPIQSQFKQKLAERVLEPYIPASRLRGLDNAYKIKLRASGYRLTYQVDDAEMAIYVLSVGKREHGIVYRKASERGSYR